MPFPPIPDAPADYNPSVGVITPTTGDKDFGVCLASVAAQDYPNLRHYIVVDGPMHEAKVRAILGEKIWPRVTLIVLPEPTGKNGYYGYRIYGSIPLQINTDFVCYLDEDNWFNQNHVSSLVKLAGKHNLDWAYTLRNITAPDGTILFEDNCDSLGIWGSWHSQQHHIDISCYLVKRDLAASLAWIFNRKGYSSEHMDSDRALCRWLLHNNPKGFTTGEYSVNYRLSGPDKRDPLGRETDSALHFYQDGNAYMQGLYKFFPWRKATLYHLDTKTDLRRVVA
jgi:glycosyltransferase involved in cell wall biosynthesis